MERLAEEARQLEFDKLRPSWLKNFDGGWSFTIFVLTFHRPKSLERLLESVVNADYEQDLKRNRIRMVIRVDGVTPDPDTVAVLENFDWRGIPVDIHYAREQLHLRRSWLEAKVTKPISSYENFIILEDDAEVSVLWYRYMKEAWRNYGHRKDIAGMTLQKPHTCLDRHAPNDTDAFCKLRRTCEQPMLDKLPGSIGMSPQPDVWYNFLQWTKTAPTLDELESHVHSTRLKSEMWYNSPGQKKTIWTHLFIYYIEKHELWNLAHSPRHEATWGVHWQEKGEHAQSSANRRDYDLVTENPFECAFPRRPYMFNWNNFPIVSYRGSYLEGVFDPPFEGQPFNLTQMAHRYNLPLTCRPKEECDLFTAVPGGESLRVAARF